MSGRRIGLEVLVSAALICAAGGVLAVLVLAGGEPELVPPTTAAPLDPAATSGRPESSVATDGAAAATSVEVEDAVFPDGATLTVRGTVRDDAGTPVDGALVRAAIRLGEWEYRDARETVSDAGGAFAIEGLDPARAWSLHASADGLAESADATAVVATPRRLEAEYDLVLRRLGSIEVVVKDASGAPVKSRPIVLRVDAGDDEFGTTELVPGRYRVVIVADGRAPDVHTVDVGAGVTRLAAEPAEEESVIEGMLLASDLTPMRGFRVWAHDSDIPNGYGWRGSKTAEDGTFRIEGLRRAVYSLGVAGEDFALDGGEGVKAPAKGVRLVVRDDARVTWRIVYPNSPDIDRSADVVVTEFRGDRNRRLITHWKGDVGSASVPGGEEVTLHFAVQGCSKLRRTVRVRPGETADLGDLQTELAGEIAGRIVDGAGRGVPNALLIANGDRQVGAVTDANGWFLVNGLPSGDGTLVVEAFGFARTRVPYAWPRTEPMILTMTPGGRLVVRGATAGSKLRAIAGDVAVDLSADSFGEAQSLLVPGRWRIESAGRDAVEIDVREGATTSVRFGGVSR